ncbi:MULTISPECIES: TonB-dependent siderophore receptor [unclassified Pseudomonas]|uniref:TonB-dependent siderophore receptor n=1 Tax=unclassified Pseudomonas TaxID=196821 RepID=UPI000C86A9EF|nr:MULTISPECIES: TonB-dependent siderophore receptor [unclassified Pseudomonas]PMV18171.1 TonB-dependent siderophore receptor [Pseudomonas sp. FW305-3-2-15-C-TSA2]PMV20387.1 TonB-dependent siderophore receptor [Pseudomonas sp. DP16D-L5]PMV33602.1 TonB-dependent siderophore receptor [Pseudomonas sp. FW305-3-2-15-A-LB2]PMV39133.1 TonB-dependent siderophore receptor [Pseudomonas sp. FW305-3-2-15-C-R2A1]PMV43590.1 TonB-dependent siderophore receptor [Pseudomonas sp. FW305-3-2-15-C-LB1]
MFAPFTRSMTLTIGLFSVVASPDLLAETDPENKALELRSTSITAEGLGATTEHTGAYTTGSMSTATRLNLSVKETPQSISVITRQQMDDFNLNTLTEVLRQTTGVNVQHNDSDRVSYSSRGYGINNFQIDGMLNTFGYMKSDSDTIIYDRIEVVRGATGLTTGAGDPSATVNMVRKRPTAQWQAKTGVSGGSHDNYYSFVDVGGPLAYDGKLRGRTVLAYRDSQSFRDNYALQRAVGYGILEGDLSDDTVLAVGFDYQDKKVQGTSWGTVPYWNSQGGKAGLSRSTNMAAHWSSWPLTDKTTFASLDHRLGGDWHLKAAYTHRQSDTDGKVYYGGAGFPNDDRSGMTAWASHMRGTSRMEAVDLNLAGSYALLGREHELMVGYGEATQRDVSPVMRDNIPDGYYSIEDWKYMGGIGKFPDTVTGLKGEHSSKQQKAGYLATRLSLTERLHAVLGSRYGSWELESAAPEYTANDQLLRANKTRQTHNDMWTPYAGLLYDITPEYTAYASYTDIFKPQSLKDVSNKYLEPVVGSNYEVGLKGSLLQERLNVAAAYFWSKQDNVAERDDSVPPNPITGEEYYKSGGKGNKVSGFELEVAGEVMPDWNLTAGYTYTHSVNGTDKRNNTGQPLNLLKVSSAYRLPGAWRNLTVGGAVNWQSDIHEFGNRPTGARDSEGNRITTRAKITQQAYSVVNLMSRYQFDEHVTASLNVNNLFDKKYYERVGFYNGVYWGDPRSVTLALDWKL